MQLLYVANRYEQRGAIQRAVEGGTIIVCDRYVASSIAYGEAQGLDPEWLADIQRFLPAPDLTIVLDIAPETAVQRKAAGRDRYERDLALLSRVRESYHRRRAVGLGAARRGAAGEAEVVPTCSARSRHGSRRRKGADFASPPPPSSTAAQASSVAPVVLTSSIEDQHRILRHVRARAGRRTRRGRSVPLAAGRSVCDGVARSLPQRCATAGRCRANSSA